MCNAHNKQSARAVSTSSQHTQSESCGALSSSPNASPLMPA